MPWRSADALFETFEEELKIWNRAELEGHTNRVKEYVPRRFRQPQPGNYNGRKTHCKRGHPFTEANTYRKPSGSRECLACRRERRQM